MLVLFFAILTFNLHSQELTKVFEPGSFHAIQIHNFLGPIEVKATTGPSKIIIYKYDFVPACKLTSRLVDGMIYMKAIKKEKLFSWADVKSCRVNIKVEAPANTIIYLKSKKGHIKVSGITGEVTFNIADGNAAIDGKLENISGVITKRGNIKVNGVIGNVSLKTVRGNIHTSYSRNPFSAELDLVTDRGNINLFLPEGTKLTGSFGAPRGKLVNDFKITKASLFNVSVESKEGNVAIKSFKKD